MKILLFSPPRSCSTACCDLLAAKFNLANLQNVRDEFLINQSMTTDQINQYLSQTDNYVAKIHSTQFYAFPDSYTEVPWSAADLIVLTERQNKLDQIASFLLRIAWEENQTIRPINYRDFSESDFSGEVDISRFPFIKKGFQKYNEVKQYLLENFPEKCVTVNYESFQLNTEQEIASQLSAELDMLITVQDLAGIVERRTNINYATNITNYDDVVDIYHGYFCG